MSKSVSATATASTPCKFFLQGNCKYENCKYLHPAITAPAASAAPAKPKQRETPQQEARQTRNPPPPPPQSAKPKPKAKDMSDVHPSERPLCNVGHGGSDCKDPECQLAHRTQWERELSSGWCELTTVLVVRSRVVKK